MKLPLELIAPYRRRIRGVVARGALACAGAAFGLVGFGFATAAVFALVRDRYGAIAADAAIAAIYVLLTVILFAWRGRVGLADRPAAPGLGDRVAQRLKTEDLAHAAPLALGLEVAERLTPFQLVLAAALAGFVAGRKA